MIPWYMTIPIATLGIILGVGYGLYLRRKDFYSLKKVAEHFHQSMMNWANAYFEMQTTLNRLQLMNKKLLEEEAHWQAEKVLLKVELAKRAGSSLETKGSGES